MAPLQCADAPMDPSATPPTALAAHPAVPTISYPADLPITARREELVAAIRDHQVVVVAGETGSGKSTQLPKLCLEAGRATAGRIGHTQPRRIAARAVAERVAEELGTEVGGQVGFAVRFTDTVGPDTLIKVMTDGILLNEIQRDPDLSAYDTLIIDEAHERSLTIDFILGYLAQLLPRRPDLTLLITSATIDTERFSQHFGHAPVIEVSGRTHPVELRYRPLVDPDTGTERDVVDGICDAVRELVAEGPGDILVFASGERDIRDAADAIRGMRMADTEVLPLYARLSAAEQHRVFSPHRGRRIVIATNIAETSLTVPGIRYVIDPGTARISRYSRRTKVQRLPIEPISQASANQRAGRCGRIGPGICIRLYDEDDFAARPEYTEPEILRTNLASVILQMTALGLGDVARFPFVDPPDRRAVADGVALLEELDAIRPARRAPGGRRLTAIGRRLARLPIDPRLGRMVLQADAEGCVHEVMVIAAALSIQDPREWPAEQRGAAEAAHRRFAAAGSDFLTLLNLWDHVRDRQRALSGNQFRKLCRSEFLHYLRIREWQDVYGQLKRVVREMGIRLTRDPADPDAVHRALLAGLLSNIGVRDGDGREYLGARGIRFVIGRRSALAEHPPPWVMAAELVETTRLFAGTCARIRPEWVEPLAGPLLKRSYGEPRWSSSRGAAVTTERVTFRGLPIVPGRLVNLGRVDPAAAREMFIRHALVEGDWQTHHRFFHRNAEVIEEVRELEERARRRGIVAPEEVLVDFYDQRIPAEVTSARHFDRWWQRAARERPDLLDVPRELLLTPDAEEVDAADFPDEWVVDGHRLPLSYTFDPDDPSADGVTVDVPLGIVHHLDPHPFAWQVPGLRKELVETLIRGLPKALRRQLIPAPDRAAEVLARVGPEDGPLHEVLARELSRVAAARITPEQLAAVPVPGHLQLRFRVVDGDRVLVDSPDLAALQADLRAHVAARASTATRRVERRGLTDWPAEGVPRRVRVADVTALPALVDEGDSVAIRVFATEEEQQAAMWLGTRRLLRLQLPSPVRPLAGRLSSHAKLALTQAPHADVTAVAEDCLAAVLDAVVAEHGGPAWDADGFAALVAAARAEAGDRVLRVATQVAEVVAAAAAVKDRLRAPAPPVWDAAKLDIAAQLGRLVYPGFVAATGVARLPHLPRYLKAMQVRLDGLRKSVTRDADRMALVRDLEEELALVRDLRGGTAAPDLTRIRWQVEELRVSLFAQALGTAETVSEAKIRAALQAARRRA